MPSTSATTRLTSRSVLIFVSIPILLITDYIFLCVNETNTGIQECVMKFASWGTHNSRELDIVLTTDQGDLSNYMNSTEFGKIYFLFFLLLVGF